MFPTFLVSYDFISWGMCKIDGWVQDCSNSIANALELLSLSHQL